jgi:dihydrofolate synthase/folylpolyglutamate synthase
VVLDGAHTPAAARALAVALRDRFPDEDITVVIGMLGDKDPDGVTAPLRDVASRWVTVTPATPRALPGATVAEAIRRLGAEVAVKPDIASGIEAARGGTDRVIVVTGSLTTVAEARTWLGLA